MLWYTVFPLIIAGAIVIIFAQKGGDYSQNDINTLSGFTILCKVVVEIIFKPYVTFNRNPKKTITHTFLEFLVALQSHYGVLFHI